MENTSYALKIAGATLIAIMIIALIVFVFQRLSSYQQSEEDVVSRENRSQFNATFEVYDKSLMYGTDVLSCLNQAESNNQRYVYNIYYSDGSAGTYQSRMELMVQVNVTLYTNVQEEIKVYHRDNLTGSIMQTTIAQANEGTNNGYNFRAFSSLNPSGFKLPDVTFYYFTGTQVDDSRVVTNNDDYEKIMWNSATGEKITASLYRLMPGRYNTTIVGNDSGITYSLVSESASNEDIASTGKLIALLSTVTEPEQTIYNDSYTGTGYEGSNAWHSATWVTAAYDFKTKRFKCTDISYNEQGYVNSLSFEEVVDY